MLNYKFYEVIAHDGVVSISSWAKNDVHVVNTWNKYLQVVSGNKILIPAAGMRKTERNVNVNKKVLLTIGSHEVMGTKFMGTGYLIEGVAAFVDSGLEFDDMKTKFPFLTRVLEVAVTSIKRTL